MPYCLFWSSIKFQGHTGWKIDDLNPIRVRVLGQSQLSNPQICPVFLYFWVFLLFAYGCRLPHSLLLQFKRLQRMYSELCNPLHTLVPVFGTWSKSLEYIDIFEESFIYFLLGAYNGDIPAHCVMFSSLCNSLEDQTTRWKLQMSDVKMSYKNRSPG